MFWMKAKRCNFILGLCVGVYILTFLKLFVYDVQSNSNDEIIRFAWEEMQNASTAQKGDCNVSCCHESRIAAVNYRDTLKVLFDALKEDSKDKSACKILMDETVVSRALNYGSDLNHILQKRSTELNFANRDNLTNVTVQQNQNFKSKSCQPVGHSKTPLPITALASFPGSGNTWVRHLLQQATGYYTGSVYGDGTLKKQFPGEGKRDGSVVAVKIHETNKINNGFFNRAMVIIRNPYDAIKAEYTRLKGRGQHTSKISADKFKLKAWPTFVAKQSWDWFYSTIRWLSFPGPLHIIRYEKLKTNLRQELHQMVRFLNVNASDEILDCVVENSEGSFHRKPSILGVDPYDLIDKETIDLLDTFNAAIESTIVMRTDQEMYS